MSRYRGAGLSRATVRHTKRLDAEERNARTPPERRRAYREGDPAQRLLNDIFANDPTEGTPA